MTSARMQPKLVAFPRSGIAYCEELYRAVEGLGGKVHAGVWSGRWLREHVRRGDVVHIHWPSFLYFHVGRAGITLLELVRFIVLVGWLRLRGARILWTAHNLYPHDGGRDIWVHRVARRVVTRIAEHIFVHGPTAAKLVSAEFDVTPGRIIVVPHGHWRASYPVPGRAEARQLLGLPQDAALFGFVGSCRPYKNIESILAALPHVNDTSHLLIAGEFASLEYLESVRSLIEPRLASRVHLVPRFLRDDEIMTFVAALDVFVLSYKEILTSGALMLGLSAGVPVVAPRVGGIADVLKEHCGMVYDAERPGSLAEAMRAALRHTYSAPGIVAYALTFDWKISARALLDVANGRPAP